MRRVGRLTAIVAAMLILTMASSGAKIRVACVGNSITYGYTLANPKSESYPARLQEMLGEGYDVCNFGHSGTTLLEKGHRPYTKVSEYGASLSFKPDIVVIHLGINDTDPRDWPDFNGDFVGDYVRLIESYRTVNPEVKAYVANLSPLTSYHYRWRSGTRIWREKVRKAIEDVADVAGATLIDFDRPLHDRQNLIHDAVHPNAEGAELMADLVRGAITGDYGGLQLPEVYQSGMVLQRDRYLPIEGRANAGAEVKLTIGGNSYRTKADAMGDWRIVVAPLVVGKPYEMVVESGEKQLKFTDILAGEVWIASGQSNMEFGLAGSTGGVAATLTEVDSGLRIFHMQPIEITNDYAWPATSVARVDRLDYMKPSRWRAADPDSSGVFSAIAVGFGKHLRDSLGVPVGIIENAIGGAPAESYVDITTLQKWMPEILVDWYTNDYVQKWCQERAIKNAGSGHRHPYEPSYLFSAAVKPLGHMPVRGVIWYQGESNAHNIELHEQLFPLLVDSWRGWFGDEGMPFYIAQLSSLSRPSWPEFRDSQRRLAEKMEGVEMVVTMDHGDSLDVHPREKRPVAERFARQALHHVYGHRSVTPQGPNPKRVYREGDKLIVETEWGAGMTTSDGREACCFEVAETEGVYRPATAKLENNKIIITPPMDMKKPRLIRYGWQPFTRANVINSDSLPMSTFKAEIEDGADYEPEQGLEAGLSGCFAGTLPGEEVIVAGGCNFPNDPLGAASKKCFYKGIYQIDAGGDCEWRRIGSLPAPMAYGASASTGKGLVLIGGTTASEASGRTMLLRNGRLIELVQLPVAIDNAYSAAIGDKVYVVGGNQNGKPGRDLYVLDLGDEKGQWKKLKPMPGNPRVQPVMAAAADEQGEMCLWVWGGFAGRYDGHEPTLELEGLCYHPSTGKWTKLPALKDANGEAVSVGGGAACTLSDGRIAVVGGVNKDVFIEALRNQASDYLQHPVSWYRFNDSVIVFDPKKKESKVVVTSADLARAGASAVALEDNKVMVIGGELKPRIRTSQTIIVDCNE